ncbi:hypothetical protein CC86DRAFT_378629 [Ophiobolus disseminans]|uniref:MFS general substrate transporter n=1 Tax=Ophiobolus disseminans TaxID=1469910 RepID=A0A6A7AAJ4_9PLEO|nr:hypothetical protein CC86DRAFT_378629 [Ophiobolus disseminans]
MHILANLKPHASRTLPAPHRRPHAPPRTSTTPKMQAQSPPSTSFRNQFSDSAARPARVLDSPAVNRRFYAPDESLSGRFRSAPRKEKDTAKYARYRNRTVWAQALVLFNVVGIPMSQGVYLEERYNSKDGKMGLFALSVGPAVQILCILAVPMMVRWVYERRGQRSGWRIAFLVATLLVVCAHLLLHWLGGYIPSLILLGPVAGIALGTLAGISTLVLSSHYRSDVPLVSTQSGFMGFLGAVIYTVLGVLAYAHITTAALVAATLLAACGLMRRVDNPHQTLPTPPFKAKVKILIPFTLGYTIILTTIFLLPLYSPLLIHTHTPLLVSLATAAISACLAAQTPSRLGIVNTFIAASIFAGAVAILPIFTPLPQLAVLCGVAYGIGLGAIVALESKVAAGFCGRWGMVVGGVGALVGIVGAALVMEGLEMGSRVVGGCAAGGLVLGGICVGVARGMNCPKVWVVV